MSATKQQYITLAEKILSNKYLTPHEIDTILNFKKPEDNPTRAFLIKMSLPASLCVSALFNIFPTQFSHIAQSLPSWTNLSSGLLAGLNYFWDFLGEPIRQTNIMYHLPNIILYTFGIKGIKTLIDTVERKTWLDKVLSAQSAIRTNIQKGNLNLNMKNGHSLLFVGNGDFIGMQFALNLKADETVTISQGKPHYTNIWNHYDISTLFENLQDVLVRSDGKFAGEYVFFPVKDEEIFLPNETAFDLSPHKLDIICQNIRTCEQKMNWKPKRIIIIGDKFHKSFVYSVDKNDMLKDSEDSISLQSISKKYKNITLLDPTDIVIKKILEMAKGRKIVFRATPEGIQEYQKRFYNRLEEMGYQEDKNTEGILTIGYDIFEDQTEQQTLAGKIDSYYPVVLSKNVSDALLRNGYKKNEFIYVPDLVLETLSHVAKEQ